MVPGWRPIFVDVLVVHPYSTTAGRAAADAERGKELKYRVWRDQARIADCDFYPLVVEAFGRVGEGTRRLIRRMASRAAMERGLSPEREWRRWLDLLGVCLQLSQAEALLDG